MKKFHNSLRPIFLVAASLLLLFSCDKNKIYKKIDDDFKDNRWTKNDVRQFDFKVAIAGSYDLNFVFSHVYDTPLSNIPVTVTVTAPDGIPEVLKMVMHIRDENGKQLGDCTGDYCDFKQPLYKGRKLMPGKYLVSISNDFDYQYMPNVLGVGIEVNKSVSQ
jgi:gliding motility-associated lipoprotein GldH